MRQIRSGQPFLYRENGLNSTVLEVRLRENVHGSSLQQALSCAMVRYPYFQVQLVQSRNTYFLAENTRTLLATPTKRLRVLGSMATGYHLLDVTFFNRSIRIAFHHALCDGRGIQPFVETLVYYYCCARSRKALDATGIRLASQPLLAGETAQSIGTTRYDYDASNVITVDKDGFALPSLAQPITAYYRTELQIPEQAFLAYAKQIGATPAILLSLLLSDSIATCYGPTDKPIVCSMATDYRAKIGVPNTYENCVGSLYLPYTAAVAASTPTQQAQHFRALLQQQQSVDAVRCAVNAQIGLFDKLDALPTLAEKRHMMAMFNDMCINTYVISYLGQFNLQSCAPYLDSIHLYNSGVAGLRVNMIAAADCFSIDVLQSFADMCIVTTLQQKLQQIGMPYTCTPASIYETVKDCAQRTAAHRWHDVPVQTRTACTK